MSARRAAKRAAVVRARCDGCDRVMRLDKLKGGMDHRTGEVFAKPCPFCGSETGTYA